LAVRLGAGSLLRVGRERDWLGSARLERRGVDVLELRPLLVDSGSTASAGRSSSRLAPDGTGGRLPGSLSMARASVMAGSFLTGSRGADRGSAVLAGTEFN
jgi:hypothetical protein